VAFLFRDQDERAVIGLRPVVRRRGADRQPFSTELRT